MLFRALRVALASLVTTLPTHGRSLLAQSVGVELAAVDVDHPLVGTVFGISASYRTPFGDSAIGFQLAADYLWDSNRRSGFPCAGLILPGSCPRESVQDDARMIGADAGVTFAMSGVEPGDLAFYLNLRLVHLRSDTHGLASGRVLPGRKAMWGGEMGIRGAWRPFKRPEFTLTARAGIGALRPIHREIVLDGYTPFEETYRTLRLAIGAAWTLPASRPAP